MPYPNEHACRLRAPAEGAKTRRKNGERKHDGRAYDVIYQEGEGGAWHDQAFRYKAAKWTEKAARAHCEGHGGTFEPASGEGTSANVTAVLEATDEVRKEVYGGRPFLVRRVVALVEGVHNRLLYPAEEIAKFPSAWNGRPFVLRHPRDADGRPVTANSPEVLEERGIGHLFAMRAAEGGELSGETWLDEGVARERAPKTLARYAAGERLEVSTGLWGDVDPTPGIWRNEEYAAVLRNHRPDHLALLPEEEGACSIRDGCGLRANGKEETMNIQEALSAVRAAGYAVLAISHEEVRDRLNAALAGLGGEKTMRWVARVWDNEFVYEETAPGSETKLFRRGYAVSEDKVVLGEGAIEVVRKEDFIPVAGGAPNAAAAEEVEKVVRALVACPLNEIGEEKDAEALRAALATLPPETLARLNPREPEAPPAVNDVEALVALAAEPLRADVRRGIELVAAEREKEGEERDDLVRKILANEKNQFKEADLRASPLKGLRGIVALMATKEPEPIFAGRGGGPPAAPEGKTSSGEKRERIPVVKTFPNV